MQKEYASQRNYGYNSEEKNVKMYFDKALIPNVNLESKEKVYEEWKRKMCEYIVTGEPKMDKAVKLAEKVEK